MAQQGGRDAAEAMARQLAALRSQMQQFSGNTDATRAKVRAIIKRCDAVRADVDALLADAPLPADAAEVVRADLQNARDGLATANRALADALARLGATD